MFEDTFGVIVSVNYERSRWWPSSEMPVEPFPRSRILTAEPCSIKPRWFARLSKTRP